jgi:uncharacterized phage protein gp47/JayE
VAFEAKKFADIFTAMRQRAQAGGTITDFEVGSVARTLAESFSYEIAQLYEQMRLVYLSAFVDTAEGQQLDMVVSILGITRGEPDFAEGVVTFQRDIGNEDINIQFGTLVATEDTPDSPKKVYQTIEPKTLPKDQTSIEVRVQALNRGEAEVVPTGAIVVMPRPVPGIKSVINNAGTTFTGKRRETDDELRERAKNVLISSGKASVIAIENALLSLPGVRDVRVIEKFDEEPPQFGLIDVFVDGIDFEDADEVRRVRVTLDEVRAAGIFALLKAAVALEIESVFRIEINPSIKLSPEERIAFEDNVRKQIETYIESLKMGDPLLLSQITKSILSVNGVNDLQRFTLNVNRRNEDGTIEAIPFNPDTDRRLSSAPSERFKAATVCVASEDKLLPIKIDFQSNAGLTTESYNGLRTALTSYFNGLALGAPVDVAQITSAINDSGITLSPGTLVLTPKPWCGNVPVTDTAIPVRFVEKATLGDLFAYHSTLKITGALRLTLPASLTDAAKNTAREAVRAKLQTYLDNLQPEADVVFQEMADLAQTVNPVQAVDFDPDDFRARLNDGSPLPARVGDNSITVDAFEKPQFEFFAVASSTQEIEVTITKVNVVVTVPGTTPTGAELTQRQNEVKNGIAGKALMTNLDVGEALNYDAVQDAVEALIPGMSYTVTALEMTGVSRADGRTQILTSVGTSLHVRSVEIITVKPIGQSAITVNVTGTTR